MKNPVIEIRSEFNEEVIQGMTKQEHDLLMAVLAKIKRKGAVEVPITFDELRELFNRPTMGNSTISELSYSLWNKVKVVDYTLYAFGKPSGGVPLFGYWGVDEENLSLKVQINPNLEYFVNSFENGNYSSLMYRDFRQTKDKYGKLLFVLLSKWKSVGKLKLSREELEHRLDVPEAYRNNARLLNDKVLKPALKSLNPFFEDLKMNKIKSGRKITHYEFSFKKQLNRKWDPSLTSNRAKRKDVTPENKSVDELQDELQCMWEEQGLER